MDTPLQMLVTNLDYDEHKGRIAIGRVQSGTIRKGDSVAFTKPGGCEQWAGQQRLGALSAGVAAGWPLQFACVGAAGSPHTTMLARRLSPHASCLPQATPSRRRGASRSCLCTTTLRARPWMRWQQATSAP